MRNLVVVIGALSCSTIAYAQASSKHIPIRTVSSPLAATTTPLKVIPDGGSRELTDGRYLVNAGLDRQLLIYDAALTKATVIADTGGNGKMDYPPFAPRIVLYPGDSTLLLDMQSRSLLLLGPTGESGRVLATPTAQFVGFGQGGGIDSKGRVVYGGLGGITPPAPCVPNTPAAPPAPPANDSAVIVRADFVTRTMDTVARSRNAVVRPPEQVRDAECRITAIRFSINPMLPSVDTWTMTSTGVLAIVRGADYHMEFVYADGKHFVGPKMPFDWRRLTDDDKQKKLDSARKVIDSLTTLGGYKARVCGSRVSEMYLGFVPPAAGAAGAGGAGGGGGGGSGGDAGGGAVAVGRAGGGGGAPDDPATNLDCHWIPVAVQFPALSEIPDYIPPVRANAPKPDLEGNIWIMPTTSLGAKDGILYDVVNPKGEVVERVQLPKDRDILAFGKGGVLYLSRRESGGVFVEKVRVNRN